MNAEPQFPDKLQSEIITWPRYMILNKQKAMDSSILNWHSLLQSSKNHVKFHCLHATNAPRGVPSRQSCYTPLPPPLPPAPCPVPWALPKTRNSESLRRTPNDSPNGFGQTGNSSTKKLPKKRETPIRLQ